MAVSPGVWPDLGLIFYSCTRKPESDAVRIYISGYGLWCFDVLSQPESAFPGVGFGVMGDSSSDEYRADDWRGGAYADTTLNWVELLVKYRGLDFGSWGTRDYPRRTGYEYNWALTGEDSEGLISSGQHTGLAQQLLRQSVLCDFKNRS